MLSQNIIKAFLLTLGAAAPFPATLYAQAPSPHYHAQADTLYYESTNPYHMYWVRGQDTLGGIRFDRAVDRQVWAGRPEALDVRSWSLSLDVNRKIDADTFELTATGRVGRINGKPPGVDTRVDLVPTIPAVPLSAGLTWTDTLSSEAAGPAGLRLYHVVRLYRVESMTDSLGHPMLQVSDSGTVRYRDGFAIDSAGSTVWLDVSGPVTERFSLDLANGRLETRSWVMNLVGIGGIPNASGGVDTVPAGLLSSERVRRIDRAKAMVLTRPLVGSDTSLTSSEGAILLHTVLRGRDSIVSGFARNDGLVGTVTTSFSGPRPTRYRALWTDSSSAESRSDIVVEGSRLRLRGLSGGDTVLTAPAQLWGIADYAMQEHLVPVLMAVPQDNQPHPFAIYRPVGQHWDQGTVTIRKLSDSFIATIVLGQDKPQYLLITQDGDLLFGENSDPTGARREPSGERRQQRLAAIMLELQ